MKYRESILFLSALSLPILPVAAQERPNIILIMADDMGWGDVGFNGNQVIHTPHLDSLSRQGIVFSRFYSACAVSSPTRASVLTGRNPFRMGVFGANIGILRPEEVTLPELLQQQGYMTGHFGKWHLGTLTCSEQDANRGRKGNTKEFNVPMEHGYLESFVTESKVPTYDPMLKPVTNDGRFWDCLTSKESSLPYGTFYWKHSGEKEQANLSGDDSRVIMDRLLPFIQRSLEAKRPFFSALWFHAPHLPCVASPEYARMYSDRSLEERNYYGCISALDEQIGRLVDYLKEHGLYDNTILCFCSDNGPEIKTPGSASNLKGRKRDLYEGGIRVPSFVVWPDQIKPNQVSDHIAGTVDYLPTFVELLNLQKPAYQLDGESLVPFFQHQSVRRKPMVFVIGNQGAIMEQRYKLVYNKGSYELYDIVKDPEEKQDVSSMHPQLFQQMKDNLHQSIDEYKASFEGKEYGTSSVERMNQQWLDIFNVK